MSSPTLSVNDVAVAFGSTPALRGVSFTAEVGDSIAVVGPSGSGKSTLLHVMSGLLRPTSGSVEFQGVRLQELTDNALADLRMRRFGFVFQRSDLIDEFTLAENIALPLELAGSRFKDALKSARAMCVRLGIDNCADRLPRQVSGGQRQRAAVGRALIARPQIVFADEPTGALDTRAAAVVVDSLREACQDYGAVLVMVTHSNSSAAALSRRLTLVDGSLAKTEQGSLQ